MNKIKIALLSGGISGEREVSLKTGEKIYEALNKEKYEIFRYDPKNNLRQFINDAIDKKFDLVMPALHGPFGEDGKIQGLMDMLGIPYVFSRCLASALAMDKYKTKIIVKNYNIPVIPDILFSKKIGEDEIINKLGLPLVIKPSELGSSVGISLAKTKEELSKGLKEAEKYSSKILIEKYIKGRELTVVIMGNKTAKALPVIEIMPKTSEWFDFQAKYTPGASKEVCPANIPKNIKEKIQEYAIKIHKAIGCKDLSRADFIWNEVGDNKIYFLEINTIPGMTETSLAPQAAKAIGLEFNDFLDELISKNIE